MTKKQRAVNCAEGAITRFRPFSDSPSADARAFYSCAEKNFHELSEKLTADQIRTLGFILDDLIDSLRADQTARAEQRPSRPLGVPQHADLYARGEDGINTLVDSRIPDNEDSIKAAILLSGPGEYEIRHYSDNAPTPYLIDYKVNPA